MCVCVCVCCINFCVITCFEFQISPSALAELKGSNIDSLVEKIAADTAAGNEIQLGSPRLRKGLTHKQLRDLTEKDSDNLLTYLYYIG